MTFKIGDRVRIKSAEEIIQAVGGNPNVPRASSRCYSFKSGSWNSQMFEFCDMKAKVVSLTSTEGHYYIDITDNHYWTEDFMDLIPELKLKPKSDTLVEFDEKLL